MRRLIATLTAALLSVALLAPGHAVAAPTAAGTASSSSANGYVPPPIPWGLCPTSSLRNAGAQCGLLTVPLDYAKPSGAKIQLMVSRILHKVADADYQGIMLVNPGGPGGSGLGLARLGQFVPNHGGDPYDWIGFDPRGVGRSIPSLSCDGDYFAPGRPYYVPETPDIRQAWWDKTRQYARDCAAARGALLWHPATVGGLALLRWRAGCSAGTLTR